MTYRFSGSSGILIISLLFLFLGGLISVRAQIPAVRSLDNPDFQNTSINISANPVVDGTLQILAIMVEFQPDENRFTSGNGTFGPGSIPYLENPGTNIDALPHNREYFEAHLEFAKNYFEKMSQGRLKIEYHVLPDVFRLPVQMHEYSPIGEEPELTPLALLARDSWMLVAQKGLLPATINPQKNTAFVIFHAGVGRDIQLTGTSLDKTPQDIPSVYLSRQAFRNLLSDPSFSGFEIDNGNLLVDNTLVLPRTLTRSGEDITGNRFVLPLSTNGMVTAQIGSHLGLPDLFNTKTGESGIGRFGLMDGAGIFAFNGLFPPGLSAWERIFLGWAEPFDVPYESNLIELQAISVGGSKQIAKVGLSSDEYFLIENRHRDPLNDGVTITIRRADGSLAQQTFTNRDEVFINQHSGFDRLLEPGVVVDVSNYDFALPGGLDASGDIDRMLNGGILIWHIDESVIRQKLGREGINNDPHRRAVNLREADGAQDIGNPVSAGLFRNESNGSAFDFWWSGNNSTVITPTGEVSLYQNRFGPDTYPDNHSNSGAISFFEIFDFSDNLPVASFRIHNINPVSHLYQVIHSRDDLRVTTYTRHSDEYYRRYPLAMQPVLSNMGSRIIIPGSDGVHIYQPDSDLLYDALQSEYPVQQPYISSINGVFTLSEKPTSGKQEITITGYEWPDELARELWEFTAPSPNGFISSSEQNILDIDGTRSRFNVAELNQILLPEPTWFSEVINGHQARIESNNLILHTPGGVQTFSIRDEKQNNRIHTGIIKNGNSQIIFYLFLDDKLTIYTPDSDYAEEINISENSFIDWPAIADFNTDGNPEFLFIDYDLNILAAKNKYGATLSNFPVHPPPDVRFIGTPLIADLNGDGFNEVIITGQDQFSLNIYAYNQSGKIIDGFPLYVGGVSAIENQPVHPLLINEYLIAVSHTGDLKVWKFPHLSKTAWSSRYGNQTNNKVSSFIQPITPQMPIYTLLNKDETYNWPNPAVDETFLRFETDTPADVRVRVTTMSGRLIYDKTTRSRGGLPEEIRIETTTWASGGYIALIEAKANSITEQFIVKIAIVK
jgi:hypothetical protein